jgi:hypothetical protein
MTVAELGTEANKEKQKRRKKEYEGERKTLQDIKIELGGDIMEKNRGKSQVSLWTVAPIEE